MNLSTIRNSKKMNKFNIYIFMKYVKKIIFKILT